jgi:predicted ATPase
MGKSRLVLEALRDAYAMGFCCVSGAGDPIERVAPYHAWRSIFAALLGGADETDDPTERAERALGALPESLRPLAPLLNLILGVELPETEESQRLQGERRIQHTRRLCLEVLAEAASGPLLIAVDDGHWLDSASWALLVELSGRDLPICILLATRPGAGLAPEFEELLSEPATQRLSLAPLDAGQSVQIACERLGVERLPAPVIELVAEKAAGNPLFVEELAYALRDSGLIEIEPGSCRLAAGQDLAALELPDTVEGIIGSRIDRLEPQPELVLKVASAVGLTFTPDVIHDVYPLSEDRGLIDKSIDTLVRRDLTIRVPPPPGLAFSFRHPLTREVAYNRMLYSQRRELHQELASWFETRFAKNLEPMFATLAYHWSRAGDEEKGVHYLELAREQAHGNGMSREAANLGLRAAELLGESIPRDPDAVRAMIAQTMESIAARMADCGVEGIAELPLAQDARKAAATGALLRVGPSLYVSQQVELFVLVGLRNFLLTLEHGATPFTPGVVAIYAMILRAMTDDVVQAFALASLAERLADRDSPAMRAYASYVFRWFIKPWLEPVGPDLERLRENAAVGFAHGDLMFGCFNSAGYVVQLAASGAPLADVIAAGTAASEEIAGRMRSAAWHALHETQLAKALAGRTIERCSFTDRPEEGTVEEERDLASIMQTDLYDQIGFYMNSKLRLHLLYREYRRAVAFGERVERVMASFAGQVQEVEFVFLFALALLARHGETGDPETLARAQGLAERLREWERQAPRVFAHKTLALTAARARATGDSAGAASLFLQAASAAQEIGFTHHVALGYELAGRSYVEAGDVARARETLASSRDAYERWGAFAKVADIDEALADLGD